MVLGYTLSLFTFAPSAFSTRHVHEHGCRQCGQRGADGRGQSVHRRAGDPRGHAGRAEGLEAGRVGRRPPRRPAAAARRSARGRRRPPAPAPSRAAASGRQTAVSHADDTRPSAVPMRPMAQTDRRSTRAARGSATPATTGRYSRSSWSRWQAPPAAAVHQPTPAPASMVPGSSLPAMRASVQPTGISHRAGSARPAKTAAAPARGDRV